jgi:magnesium chelatase subunit I
MNPEEGELRPQIQDRFGLRVLVRGANDPAERLEIYRRAVTYRNKPYKFITDWAADTQITALEIAEARKRLPKVTFAAGVLDEGLRWIEGLKIDSHRAEMTLFEAGRAYAAADDRLEVTIDDLRAVAPMALRQRQTNLAAEFYTAQEEEHQKIGRVIKGRQPSKAKKRRAKKPTATKDKPSIDGPDQGGARATEQPSQIEKIQSKD